MTSLPSGMVTFLLTDIEGSSRLWETHLEGMGTALAEHDRSFVGPSQPMTGMYSLPPATP